MVPCISAIVPINSGGIYWNVFANAAFRTLTPTSVNHLLNSEYYTKIIIYTMYGLKNKATLKTFGYELVYTVNTCDTRYTRR